MEIEEEKYFSPKKLKRNTEATTKTYSASKHKLKGIENFVFPFPYFGKRNAKRNKIISLHSTDKVTYLLMDDHACGCRKDISLTSITSKY